MMTPTPNAHRSMLNQSEAEEIVLARLGARYGGGRVRIVDGQTVERAFGWVFTLAADDSVNNSEIELPRQVILNKYSEQLVACSVQHSPKQLIKLYEKLLSQHQSSATNWCLTGSFPFPWRRWWKGSMAQRASESGFYEIGAKEGDR
jgi:hypothetical protein